MKELDITTTPAASVDALPAPIHDSEAGLTPAEVDALTATLCAYPALANGLGSEDRPCTMAAINLFLGVGLTDSPPLCMSVITRAFIIKMQDAAPAQMRNGMRWRVAAASAAGTGRDTEADLRRVERLDDWVYETILPLWTPTAEKLGYGDAWAMLLATRDFTVARAAWEGLMRVVQPPSVPDWVAMYLLNTMAPRDMVGHILKPDSARRQHHMGLWGDALLGAAVTVLNGVRNSAKGSDQSNAWWAKVDPCHVLEQLNQTAKG